VLIYGAGHTGRQLAAAMAHSPELQLAGFLDDDALLHGRVLNGQPIHDPAALDTLVRTLNVRHVLLAMPNLPRGRRRLILGRIRSANVAVRTLPSMTDLAQGRVTIAGLRELDVDDLLGREPVPPDPVLMARSITAKNVLVTGAGGSIGSELCRQILQGSPARLILVDQNEFALYRIHQELGEPLATPLNRSAPALVALLASVQDRTRMDQIMSEWRPHTVYHAAAYKHVPLVEQNLVAGLANNVLGSLHTAQAAIASKVRDFVLVSTDKAVRPTSVMGASKRLAEMILQALAAEQGQTRFSMVRFGNVLGSSGSVVPRFRKQIRDGGPITLTHPEVTRFFMTIPEAAQLVIQAGAMAEGGDVFVLDMGEPVRVMELARRVVELSGLTVKDAHLPEGDIAIEITGLRPGEKLYEELLTEHNAEATAHPRILRAQEDFIGWEKLAAELEALACALSRNDAEAILGLLCALVPHYTPATAIPNPADRVQGSESEPPNATSSTLEHLCENRHESVLPTG